jgi:hypothetical protein
VEVFGAFPDATALATLGFLLARGRIDAHLFVVPFASCAIGAATLAALDQPEPWQSPPERSSVGWRSRGRWRGDRKRRDVRRETHDQRRPRKLTIHDIHQPLY